MRMIPVADMARTINLERHLSPYSGGVDRVLKIMRKTFRIEIDPAKVLAVERAHPQAHIDTLCTMIGWAPHGDLCRGLPELLLHEGVSW
jgi:hypothetical protein